MAAPTFDLQSHSTASDGSLAPAAVVAAAREAGVELLALTDHDTVDGVDEALAAARDAGLRLVPATEITAVDAVLDDLHVLGYGVDHRDAAFLALLEASRADRGRRAERMLTALRELGFAADTAALDARRAQGLPIGRPHLAQAVHGHPANAARLRDEGLATFGDVLEAYLIPGKPAFLLRETPTIEQAVDGIHAAGGVAVWAHPFWDVADPATVTATLERFAALGVDGVEAFYITHTREQTLLLADTADRLGLLSTGSADFHGPGHPGFSRFRAFDLHGRVPVLGPVAGPR